MGIFKHQKDHHSPGIVERAGRMALDWSWNGIKGYKVGNFLLWYLSISWSIKSRIALSSSNTMEVTNVSHVYHFKFSRSQFKK